MKRILFTLMLLFTIIGEAMAQNDAMYVYRNDGAINAFLKTDIDSICYSQLDLDSVFHSNYVIQEVWTVDSTYRIPLEVIDSVSFVTPPTVYKTDVTNLAENLLQYIIGAANLTLKLNLSTPKNLIPKAGDKIILLEGCEAVPNGFAGKVVTINTSNESIDIVCEQTYIEDLFDSYCKVQSLSGYVDKQPESYLTRAVYNPADNTFQLGPYSSSIGTELSLSIIPDSDLALKGGVNLSVSLEPTFRIHTFLMIGEDQGMYFSSSITGNLEIDTEMSLYGGLEWSPEFLNPVDYFPIPQTAGLINFYINPGWFVRADATISSTLTTSRNYAFGMSFDYSSIDKNVVKPYIGGRLASSKTEVVGSLDGSIALGEYLETGFSLCCRELAKVCVRGECGWQVSGNFVLRNSDIDNAEKETELYEKLKASSIEYGPFVNLSLIASVLGSGPAATWELKRTQGKKDLVPTFDNTKLSQSPDTGSSLDAYTELSGDCITPIQYGFKLFKNKTEVAEYNATTAYSNEEKPLEYTFTDMKMGKYTVYPTVNVFNREILATPNAILNTIRPKITEVKQTGSEYSNGEYTFNGRKYDYKFEVSTTVEIESTDGIADWGYVYKDLSGNINHISLKDFKSPYTDTRYVYYRNEAKSSVCLYGYVKYEGNETYYYNEPTDYPLEHVVKVHSCPDNHHPHAIDLGLPSGTKWSCCNVGAKSPTESGGYYAWGETSEKILYDWETYSYGTSEETCQYLGVDIAGTSYDVAHVIMGNSWQMPTVQELHELRTHTTHEWTQKEGVNGLLLTGKNGGQIFLPAAGARIGYDIGSKDNAIYWSSMCDQDRHFYAESHRWYNMGSSFSTLLDWRMVGHTVRAVSK